MIKRHQFEHTREIQRQIQDSVKPFAGMGLCPQRHPQPQQTQPTPPFQRQPKSISSFVAGFKSATVKRIDDWIDANQPTMAKFNKNNPLWQSNYYDHIIRDEMEYRHIAEYIVRNPIVHDDAQKRER